MCPEDITGHRRTLREETSSDTRIGDEKKDKEKKKEISYRIEMINRSSDGTLHYHPTT
jgi:hypothetical protein